MFAFIVLSLAHDLAGSVDCLIPLVLDKAQEDQPVPILLAALLCSVRRGAVLLHSLGDLSRGGCVLRQLLLQPYVLSILGSQPP